MNNLTPRSDYLIQEVARHIAKYLAGEASSPETCIEILRTLDNWESEITAEERALIDASKG